MILINTINHEHNDYSVSHQGRYLVLPTYRGSCLTYLNEKPPQIGFANTTAVTRRIDE